jgi:hypothetical protein
MSLNTYGWQQFHKATLCLVWAGSQRERLVGALAYCLVHVKPDEDLPEEIRHDFKTMMQELASKPARGNEGTFAATVATLSDLDVSRYCEKIVSMYDAITRELGKE